MEAITKGVNNINISGSTKNNRIHVSNSKKPIFFFVNLAKSYMKEYNEVELSALGSAIASVVSVAEILKHNGLAVEKKIRTSTVVLGNPRGRAVQKARIEVVLEKTANFDKLMAATAAAENGEIVAAAKIEEQAATMAAAKIEAQAATVAAAKIEERAATVAAAENGEKAAAAENEEQAATAAAAENVAAAKNEEQAATVAAAENEEQAATAAVAENVEKAAAAENEEHTA